MIRFLDIMDKDKRRNQDEGVEPEFKRARLFMGGLHYQILEVANMAIVAGAQRSHRSTGF